MASVFLGSVLKGATFAPLNTVFGKFAASMLGNVLGINDQHFKSQGRRLKEFSIQTASYGNMIPIVYGTARISGNIIWARPIREEHCTTRRTVRQGKGARVHYTNTDFLYYASFAVSICEGHIDDVTRIFADGVNFNSSLYKVRIYKGTEDQLPDPLIESFEGTYRTPAFRGQAYVVFEDLPLADFGNSIPNFTFEVKRFSKSDVTKKVSDVVEGVVVLPGGGEYVYDTVTQYKSQGKFINGKWCRKGFLKSMNAHTWSGKSNAVLAIENLKKDLPKVKWVSVVVGWFGNSLNIKDCLVMPGVEYKDQGAINIPDAWSVSEYKRENAHLISSANDRPNYGGTINDISLIRFIKHLKESGYKVVLYPLLFIDMPQKPWRGILSGASEDVREFFIRYNKFIMHYCSLCKEDIDAFLIGSELIGLTSIRSEEGSYPAVDQLILLAAMCKEKLGDKVKVSYAANWDEYHHVAGGWYHLDKLWASKDIDFIGIDAYFPLSDSKVSIYDISKIQQGWVSGEGYEFYGENKDPLEPQYAWKNIGWWWGNQHTNPDGKQTEWVPKSKKIWFTEYGFPSVDCCTNQPNIFSDTTIGLEHFPKHSNGYTDVIAQQQAIIATELLWQGSEYVEKRFLWCWDARPYPYWPDMREVWSDFGSWAKGHWVQGKLHYSNITEILSDISIRAGLAREKINFSRLNENVYGLLLDSQTSAKSIISTLQQVYNFDIVEQDSQLVFTVPNMHDAINITVEEMASDGKTGEPAIKRLQEFDLPYKIDISYVDYTMEYRTYNQYASRMHTKSRYTLAIDLPIVMDASTARTVAETMLQNAWESRLQYSFYLPTSYMSLKVGDVIKIGNSTLKISGLQIGRNNMIKVEAIAFKQRKQHSMELLQSDIKQNSPISATEVIILDLPYMQHIPGDDFILLAAVATTNNWNGALCYISLSKEHSYQEIASIDKLSTTGYTLKAFKASDDEVYIQLMHGSLYTITENELVLGGNICLIGKEIIQFQEAKRLSEYEWVISKLNRNVYFQVQEVNTIYAGERFTLLDSQLTKVQLNNSLRNKEIFAKSPSIGQTLGEVEPICFHYSSNANKLYPPLLSKKVIEDDSYIFEWLPQNRGGHKNFISEVANESYKITEFLLDKNNCKEKTKEYVTTNKSITIDKNAFSEIHIAQLNHYLEEGLPLILRQ